MITKFKNALGTGKNQIVAVNALDICLIKEYLESYFTRCKSEIIVRVPDSKNGVTTLYVQEEIAEAINIWEKALANAIDNV